MKFHIGQMVRIVYRPDIHKDAAPLVGAEAIIVSACPLFDDHWKLNIGDPFCSWASHHLEPLTNPDESAWNEFKSRHLTPDPAIILAKEPA